MHVTGVKIKNKKLKIIANTCFGLHEGLFRSYLKGPP
jgi:hypothetical protein